MHEGWYHHWVLGATLDDQLWHQTLVMDCVLESLRGSEQGLNDVMMWMLLCQGVVNASIVDKPWDGSTCSMQYSAILVGWLWGLLARERTRVSVTFGFQRNPDVARNGGSEGRKRVRPIAIDYCTVAGTARAECKGDRRSKGPDGWSPERTPTALWRHKGKET